MELKDATHFLLLKEYVQERKGMLHYFEHLILSDCLKYYAEPQIFFFVKQANYSLSKLQECYREHLTTFATSSVDMASYHSTGEIWISKLEKQYKEKKEYRSGWEYVDWEPYFQEVWASFPKGLVLNSNYKILFEDAVVSIVLFYKKIMLMQNSLNQGSVVLLSYQKSLEKAWDIFYREEDHFSYSFMDNAITMQHLGITEYFRWLRSYKEQEEALKRKLLLK